MFKNSPSMAFLGPFLCSLHQPGRVTWKLQGHTPAEKRLVVGEIGSDSLRMKPDTWSDQFLTVPHTNTGPCLRLPLLLRASGQSQFLWSVVPGSGYQAQGNTRHSVTLQETASAHWKCLILTAAIIRSLRHVHTCLCSPFRQHLFRKNLPSLSCFQNIDAFSIFTIVILWHLIQKVNIKPENQKEQHIQSLSHMCTFSSLNVLLLVHFSPFWCLKG